MARLCKHISPQLKSEIDHSDTSGSAGKIGKVQGIHLVVAGCACRATLLSWLGISTSICRCLINRPDRCESAELLMALLTCFLLSGQNAAIGLESERALCRVGTLPWTLLSQYLGPSFYGYGSPSRWPVGTAGMI